MGKEKTQQDLWRSVGADGQGGARVLVRDLKPEPGKARVEVDLSLKTASTKPGK